MNSFNIERNIKNKYVEIYISLRVNQSRIFRRYVWILTDLDRQYIGGNMCDCSFLFKMQRAYIKLESIGIDKVVCSFDVLDCSMFAERVRTVRNLSDRRNELGIMIAARFVDTYFIQLYDDLRREIRKFVPFHP